jgi:hypothetical protein
MTPPVRRSFSRPILAAIADNKILRVCGRLRPPVHRIWSVVVDGRVFVRSDAKAGRMVSDLPGGSAQTIRPGEKRSPSGRYARAAACDAVERAYAEKYSTPACRIRPRFRSRGGESDDGAAAAIGAPARRSGDHELPWLPPSGGRMTHDANGADGTIHWLLDGDPRFGGRSCGTSSGRPTTPSGASG